MTDFAERHYAAQDGLQLYFRDYGSALSRRTPILCLPGLARNSKDFASIAARLSADRRIICPDLRGRGLSGYDPDWRHYVGPTYVGDLMQLLALTNCHRVVIIGTSMGGFLAMALSVFMPSAVAAVVLNDVGPEVPDSTSKRILEAIGNPPTHTDWSGVVSHLKKLWPHVSDDNDDAWLALAQDTFRELGDGRICADWDPNIVRPLVANTDDVPDLWRLYRSLINTPLLALRAELSDVLTPETFSRMKLEIPTLHQALIPATGHCPTLDEPASREALDAFLADN